MTPEEEARKLVVAIERQNRAFGQTSRQAQINELAMRGATAATLAFARAADEFATRQEQVKKAAQDAARAQVQAAKDVAKAQKQAAQEAEQVQERHARAVKNFQQGVGRMATAGVSGAAGVLGTQAAGGVATTAQGVAAVQQLASTIPVVGGLIGSVLGAAITAVFARTDRLNASVNQAMGSIVTGSRTADQALGRIRIDAFASEFQRVTTLAQNRRTGTFNVRQQSEAEILRQLPADMAQGVEFAERAASSLRAALNDPTVRAGLSAIRTGAAREDVRDLQRNAVQSRLIANQSVREMDLGASSQEVAAMAPALEVVARMAAQTRTPAESMAEAFARSRLELDGLVNAYREANLLAMQSARGQQVVAQNQQDRVANRAQVAGIMLMQRQASTGALLVEHTEERVRLQDELNRSLINTATYEIRIAQIASNERIELARRNAEDVSRRMEQRRRPLESFAFAQQRLEQLRPEFEARGAAGAEMLQREQAQIAQQLFQSVGPLERLGPALTEGSVAAMSAARAAEREARGVDPASQSVALLAALEAQSRSQSIYQGQLVEVFRAVASSLTPGTIPAGPG
jgi:hypothetical protein